MRTKSRRKIEKLSSRRAHADKEPTKTRKVVLKKGSCGQKTRKNRPHTPGVTTIPTEPTIELNKTGFQKAGDTLNYQILFYGGLAGALITLPISIWVYIKLNIGQVIQDLTGINPHKYTQKVKLKKSRQNDTEKPITKEIKKKYVGAGNHTALAIPETELLNPEVAATALLDDTSLDETTLLGEETELLNEELEGTTVLSEELSYFKKERDIIIVHSEKII